MKKMNPKKPLINNKLRKKIITTMGKAFIGMVIGIAYMLFYQSTDSQLRIVMAIGCIITTTIIFWEIESRTIQKN